MSERVRSVLWGVAYGVVPLLLLDLARILNEAIAGERAGDTSVWWPIACYALTGIVAAAGVAAGRRDRVIPVVAALVLAVLVLPTVPVGAAERLPALPLLSAAAAFQAVVVALVGAYLYAAVRGPRA